MLRPIVGTGASEAPLRVLLIVVVAIVACPASEVRSEITDAQREDRPVLYEKKRKKQKKRGARSRVCVCCMYEDCEVN